MDLKLSSSHHIYPLGGRTDSFLQVLIQEFVQSRHGQGKQIDLQIGDDDLCVIDGEGKDVVKDYAKEHGDFKSKLDSTLKNFNSDQHILSYKFDCSNYPMRYGSGGVLPVIRIENQEYYCLFYRDIDPVGWNIANGGTNDENELLNPLRAVYREFAEELIIADTSKKVVYSFDIGGEWDSRTFQKQAREAWALRPGLKWMNADATADDTKLHFEIPVKWVDGPDSISVTFGHQNKLTDGYFLSVTTDDNGIEVDRVAIINLKGDIAIFDGEVRRGKLYNRIVGLFNTEEFAKKLDSKEFRPDFFFYGGVRHEAHELDDFIENHYLREIIHNRIDNKKSDFYSTSHKYNLCPITGSIIDMYVDWQEKEKTRYDEMIDQQEPILPFNEPLLDARKPDIFLSFKSQDAAVARRLHEYLVGTGYRVFWTPESLREKGESDYAGAIDAALESAACLVVVGTKAEYFDSGWIGYEWRSFLNEIYSGRKRGQVFVVSGGVAVDDLPYRLRNVQVVPFTTTTTHAAFSEISQFVGRSLEGVGRKRRGRNAPHPARRV